ncbi:hypothetical protein D3C81_1418070 [compost metagenome]
MRASTQAHIPRPTRMGDGLADAANARVRPAHARMRIAITRARHRHVHGEHQRGDAGRLRALQRVAHEAAITQHVQLEPHRPLDRRCHFFNRAHRHRGQGERHATAVGGTRGLHFTATRIHAGQADRCQRHRHRQFFAEQFGFQAQLGHVAQHALAQCDVGQIGNIAPERVLGVRAAIDVVEQERRQATLRGRTVIGGGGNDHGSTVGGRKT